MFSQPKSVLIPNVSIHNDFCFLALYFKNKRQFSILVESNITSEKPYVEYNIDLGEPKSSSYSDSDVASNVQLTETSHSRLTLENRIAILQKVGYQFVFVSEQTKDQVAAWISGANASMKDFSLINEVFDTIKFYAKKNNIMNFQEPKKENCLVM
jgi:hypothetical protein